MDLRGGMARHGGMRRHGGIALHGGMRRRDGADRPDRPPRPGATLPALARDHGRVESARRARMTQLIDSGDGGGFEHCASCGALAAGPCARCRKPLCGDCCVITRHGARQWALCFRCARRGGSSLRGAWLGLLAWLGLVLAVLTGLVVLLYALARR